MGYVCSLPCSFSNSRGDCPFVSPRSTDMTVEQSKAVSLWTIFVNQYAWWIRDKAKTYFVSQKVAHFVATIHLAFIGFNVINFLKSENIFVLTETLWYHKQLSTSLIVVGDIIIGKSLDKLVMARGVKVPTKRWRGGSQTQRYGGSDTVYFSNRLMQIY